MHILKYHKTAQPILITHHTIIIASLMACCVMRQNGNLKRGGVLVHGLGVVMQARHPMRIKERMVLIVGHMIIFEKSIRIYLLYIVTVVRMLLFVIMQIRQVFRALPMASSLLSLSKMTHLFVFVETMVARQGLRRLKSWRPIPEQVTKTSWLYQVREHMLYASTINMMVRMVYR